jgi:hypothetical protein
MEGKLRSGHLASVLLQSIWMAFDTITGYLLACLDDHVKSNHSLRILQQKKPVSEREQELLALVTSWGVVMTEHEAHEIVCEYDRFMASEPGTVPVPSVC